MLIRTKVPGWKPTRPLFEAILRLIFDVKRSRERKAGIISAFLVASYATKFSTDFPILEKSSCFLKYCGYFGSGPVDLYTNRDMPSVLAMSNTGPGMVTIRKARLASVRSLDS